MLSHGGGEHLKKLFEYYLKLIKLSQVLGSKENAMCLVKSLKKKKIGSFLLQDEFTKEAKTLI